MKDTIHTQVTVRFGKWDRVKILFGHPVSLLIATEVVVVKGMRGAKSSITHTPLKVSVQVGAPTEKPSNPALA